MTAPERDREFARLLRLHEHVRARAEAGDEKATEVLEAVSALILERHAGTPAEGGWAGRPGAPRRAAHKTRPELVYAVVGVDAESAVEVFARREDAERVVAEALEDEPSRGEAPSIVEINLQSSLN
jgi:hypothetical protein